MGIYSRYSAALLVLALISPQVLSAVRVPVIQNDEYIRQVLSKQTAAVGAVSTPAGEVAFYGAEKVYAFTTGDSVRPTVREVVSTVGTPSFPYGPGAAYPTDPNLTPAAATKIKVKPQVVVPKANILSALKTGLKANPGHLALSAAVAAAVGAVGWVIEDGAKVNKPGQIVVTKTVPGTVEGIGLPYYGGGNTSCSFAASAADGVYSGSGWVYVVKTNSPYTSNGFTYVSNCAPKYVSQKQSALQPIVVSPSTAIEVNDTELSALDPWVSQQSAQWLGGLIREVCNGSLAPNKCYSTMVDRSKGMISGPAFAAGPVTSKTTSFNNPDGSVSTRTETTSTKFNFTYSNNYFDVNTEKKTTTTQDGQPVSETIENDNTVPDPAPDPAEEPQEPEPEYTFNDSPFPEVEPFYEQKYPDGLQGVWDQAKSDIDNSNFLSFLRSFVPSFSGSCPTFGMAFAIGNMGNYGNHEFQSLCYVFDFVKIILTVSAVWLARQLTFGG